jgi:HPt (histidine-containing phosphotransfer) domain-containing protein
MLDRGRGSLKLLLICYLTVLLLLVQGKGWAQSGTAASCDVCGKKITNLDQPISLVGYWLFTREDHERNKDIDTDTSDWITIKAPGPWKNAYPDKKNFRVGWYRGSFEFAPHLMGEELVFLVDTYVARLKVYLDGELIYSRGESDVYSNYHGVQPVPVRFKITKQKHVISFRTDTILMTGVYQLPFQFRKYNPTDSFVGFFHWWGGEFRMVISHIFVALGGFFLLVFFKTRSVFYLCASLTSMGTYPFYAFPGDMYLRWFAPESLLVLHYLGISALGIFPFFFSQFFYKIYPRANIIHSVIHLILLTLLIYLAIDFHMDFFQKLRVSLFIYELFLACWAIFIMIRGLSIKGNPYRGLRLLLVAEVYFVSVSTHDILLALGLLQSIALIFTGTLFIVLALLWICSINFADTFMQNKGLAQSLTEVNRNLASLNEKLEFKVEEQTRDIKSILTHIEMGILTLTDPDRFTIGSDYSPFTEAILGEADLAGKNGMKLIFARSNVNPDDLSRYSSVMAASIGENSLCWDINKENLCFEIQKILPDGQSKILELDWYAVVNNRNLIEKILVTLRDVTSIRQLQYHAQNQTKELEYIGEIVAITRDEFDLLVSQGRHFIEENRSLLRDCPQRDSEILRRLFINMHTFKGLCRSFRMKNLTSLIHAVEQKLAQLQRSPEEPWDQACLLNDLKTLDDLLQSYIRLSQEKLNHQFEQTDRLILDRASFEKQLDYLRSIKIATLSERDRGLFIEIQNALQKMMVSHSMDVFDEIQRSIGILSQDLGKEEPLVMIDSPNLDLDRRIQILLRNMFLHLIRNSMDHGIETAQERLLAGKPSRGHIHIALQKQGSELVIIYADDGRGLNIGKIREMGAKRQLLTPGELQDDKMVANLIFTPSFSTTETVSDISGRGMGMAAVVDYLDEIKGGLNLEFTGQEKEPGFRPFKLNIIIPCVLP